MKHITISEKLAREILNSLDELSYEYHRKSMRAELAGQMTKARNLARWEGEVLNHYQEIHDLLTGKE